MSFTERSRDVVSKISGSSKRVVSICVLASHRLNISPLSAVILTGKRRLSISHQFMFLARILNGNCVQRMILSYGILTESFLMVVWVSRSESVILFT